jgi:uncharacterized membrane protein
MKLRGTKVQNILLIIIIIIIIIIIVTAVKTSNTTCLMLTLHATYCAYEIRQNVLSPLIHDVISIPNTGFSFKKIIVHLNQ